MSVTGQRLGDECMIVVWAKLQTGPTDLNGTQYAIRHELLRSILLGLEDKECLSCVVSDLHRRRDRFALDRNTNDFFVWSEGLPFAESNMKSMRSQVV